MLKAAMSADIGSSMRTRARADRLKTVKDGSSSGLPEKGQWHSVRIFCSFPWNTALS